MKSDQIELEMQNEQLRQAQVDMEEMRDRYVDLYEFAPVGYFTLNRAGMIISVNLTGAALLGKERNQLLSSSFSHLINIEDIESWDKHFLSVLGQDGRQSCEVTFKRSDGVGIPVRITSLKSDGKLSSYEMDEISQRAGKINDSSLLRLTVTDLTESKKFQNELLEIMFRLRATIDALPDLLFEVGMEGRIYDYHSPRTDLLARPPEEFLGKCFTEILPAEVAEVIMSALTEAYEKNYSVGKQYALQLAQGKRWFEISVSRKPELPGKEPRFILLARDITKRIQAKLQLRDLAAHLLNVREEEKAAIAREIHDDLGNTLLTLKMETYNLKAAISANQDVAALVGLVENMSQEINQATGIVRNIITGLRPPLLDELGLLAAIEWQASQFSKCSGIKCEVNCVSDRGGLDKQYSIALFRLVQEALTNVAKHSGASLVEIEFLHEEEKIYLSITDNGRGMTENRTAHQVSSMSYGQRGMIERVKHLEGRISFNSTAGKGVNVNIIIPLKVDSRRIL